MQMYQCGRNKHCRTSCVIPQFFTNPYPGSTDGKQGPPGEQGIQGERGIPGLSGSEQGQQGNNGEEGISGAKGQQGIPGEDGPEGQQGTDDGITEYAFIYNTSLQTVPTDTADSVTGDSVVIFDTYYSLSTSGFTYDAVDGGLTINNDGIYGITFTVSSTNPNQFAIRIGTPPSSTIIPGSIFGSGAGTQTNSGQVITFLSAGDKIFLANHSSTAGIILPTEMGGTKFNTNASLIIKSLQLDETP